MSAVFHLNQKAIHFLRKEFDEPEKPGVMTCSMRQTLSFAFFPVRTDFIKISFFPVKNRYRAVLLPLYFVALP